MNTFSSMLKMAAALILLVALGGTINTAFDLDLQARLYGSDTSLPNDPLAMVVLGLLGLLLAGLGFLTGAENISKGVKLAAIGGAVLLIVGTVIVMIITDSNRYNEFYDAGNQAHGEGNFKQAIELYNKAVQTEPGRAFYYYRRAQAYNRLNDPAAAQRDFRKAIAIDPEYAIAYRQLAYMERQKGNKVACEKLLARARSLGYRSEGDLCN